MHHHDDHRHRIRSRCCTIIQLAILAQASLICQYGNNGYLSYSSLLPRHLLVLSMSIPMQTQRLPAIYAAALDARARDFMEQAWQNDPTGCMRAQTALGYPIDIWDYQHFILREGLVSWRRAGEAAWLWHSNQGRLAAGWMYCTGSRESEQTAVPNSVVGFEQWWPIIFLVPDVPSQDGKVATYCPALAWQKARPWCANIHRIYEADRVMTITTGQLPPPPPPLPTTTAPNLSAPPLQILDAARSTTTTSLPASSSAPTAAAGPSAAEVPPSKWGRHRSDSSQGSVGS